MRHAFFRMLAASALMSTLVACGGGGGGDATAADTSRALAAQAAPLMQDLQIQVSSHDGETLSPRFNPSVRHYELRVQSDIFGVLLQPKVAPHVQVSVEASITARPYSVTSPVTDIAQPEAVPLTVTYGNEGYLVKLSESYAAFDVEYRQTATIRLTHEKSGHTSEYTVTIVRDNDSALRAKFGDEQVFTAADGTQLKYHIYYPPSYATSTRTYPVVLALHGGGQTVTGGQPSDMTLKRYQLATVWAADAESDPTKEAIVITPQARSWVSGNTVSADGQAAYELLQSVIATGRADVDRIYLTGLSLGGNGSLVMAQQYPQTFAAVFMIAAWAGGINSTTNTGADYNWAGLKQYLDGQILVVHGEDDPVVPYSAYLNIASKLDAAGVSFKSVVYPTGTFFYPNAHFSWVAAYADESLREWLFSQRR